MKRNFFTRKEKKVQKNKISEDQEAKSLILDLSEEETSKSDKQAQYMDAFIKPRVLKERKSVYISQDVHEFISKIVNKIAVRDLTVGIFIDTVLLEHIKEHADELKAIYYREEDDIFKNIVKETDNDGNI